MPSKLVPIDTSSEAIVSLPTLDDLGVPLETLEAAEEIIAASGGDGGERQTVEHLLRAIVHHDRLNRCL